MLKIEKRQKRRARIVRRDIRIRGRQYNCTYFVEYTSIYYNIRFCISTDQD